MSFDLLITHPRAGPRKGIIINMAVLKARSFGTYKSAFVPEPIARTGPDASPAKSLQMTKLAKDCERPDPSKNNMYTGDVTLYTIDRPYCSLSGAAIMGPSPRPMTNTDNGRMASVRETPKATWMS
jgi:hypothetical protein